MSRLTVQQVMDRVKDKLGAAWVDSRVDLLNTGAPDTVVTGISTSFTPSIQVLKQSVSLGNNLIVTQQPAFYQDDHVRPGSPATTGSVAANFQNDPAYLYKRDFIERHQLVVWRFYDNWNARGAEGQPLGLAKALGWDKFNVEAATDTSGSHPSEAFAQRTSYYKLPESSLKQKILEIEHALKVTAVRVIGDPATKIRQASISNGMFTLLQLREILQRPEIDLIVIAEAIEWESCEYFRDFLTWKGPTKAMILLGREASEDPGYGEAASWLRTFISEVPIEWVPAGAPFWVP